ncbi:CRISPR-associated protein, Csh1 family [Methanosarcina siciliae HI350]|uniref:CRISPR-associated protein, Csh1 family n=1 Tax=Methanosarcina siciliae HI350 TaxID=1434119 RepID=A0A0E3LBG1_9EURY|nr:TIGR02556 family CRISPR-associated protein [Methanosarcina siciliae]AKB33711.1 CRISPR-associated protein, Csh1 family [Methanosarcina siciliae HI350]
MKEIGEYALEKENKDLNNFVSILVENPASNETYKHVFCIKFASDQNNFEFKGIDHQEYSKEKIVKYLYKRGSSNGPDITPTARVTEIKKTFSNKIIGWFSKPLKEAKPILKSEEIQFLERLGSCIKVNEDIILSELERKVNSIDAKEHSILTLIIEEKASIKYVGDLEIFCKVLENNGASKFYSKYNITSKNSNKVCSVCKTNTEVYGFVTPYEFYTVDKRGFVSGGFDQSKAWRNNPVCLQCALKITAGKEYIEKYMSFGFYGFKFLLIPKLLNNRASEDLFDIFENFKDKNFSFNKVYKNFLEVNENDILEILSEEDDYLNFNFQFYEKSNSAYRILLYIEDVLPSRLRELFKAKETVDKRKIFSNYFSNDTEVKSIQFTLGNVRWFFPNTLDDPDLNKYFLEITNGIFTRTSINYNFLLKYIMQRIRKDFRNENSTRYSLFLGFQMLDFLTQLNLLENYRGGKHVNSKNLSSLLGDVVSKEESDYEKRANAIFSEFENFFNTDAKKAIFLEGALVQYLLNIQKFQRGSAPFRTKLRGLNLDERYIKKIYPVILNKLEEYDSNFYKGLETLIAKYMIQSGNDWKMSNDEISFYFVLGMNLSNFLKSPKPEKEMKK